MYPHSPLDNQVYIEVYEDEPLPQPPASDCSSNSHKSQYPPRYYTTPLNADVPDSTPLNVYGLERRPPSVIDSKPRLFSRSRLSIYALDEESQERLHTSRSQFSLVGNAASVMERAETPTEPSSSMSISRRPSILSFDMLSSHHGSQSSHSGLKRMQSRLSIFRSSSSSSHPERKRWLAFKKRTTTDPHLVEKA